MSAAQSKLRELDRRARSACFVPVVVEPERREGGTKKPSRGGWALYGIPEQVGVDVCQFWPETGVNRAGGREGTGPKTARAEGQEPGPEAERTGGLDLPCKGRSAEDGSV